MSKKHEVVMAWEAFARANPITFDTASLGISNKIKQLLSNRLNYAFLEGCKAGQKYERRRIIRKIEELS